MSRLFPCQVVATGVKLCQIDEGNRGGKREKDNSKLSVCKTVSTTGVSPQGFYGETSLGGAYRVETHIDG